MCSIEKMYLEKLFSLLLIEILLQDIPEPVDYSVAIMEPSIVLCMLPYERNVRKLLKYLKLISGIFINNKVTCD